MVFEKLNELTLNQMINKLQSSYKNIDFRAAVYKKNNIWKYIVSIIRFTNKSKEEIEKSYLKLEFDKYETKNFKIIGNVIKIDSLNVKISEILESISEYKKNQSDFNYHLDTNRKNSFGMWIEAKELEEFSCIQYSYVLKESANHHNQFQFLKEELVDFGIDSIYDIIYRTLKIGNYDKGAGLFITIILPVYIKFEDELKFENNILSGQIFFHEIFENSKFFFDIYSDFNQIRQNWKGHEEFELKIEGDNIKKLSNGFFNSKFKIDFTKYESIPSFNIKMILDKKFPIREDLIHFSKFFSTFSNNQEAPINPSTEEQYKDLINQGENENIEFKSSFKWDINKKRANKELPKMVTTSICAFSNSNGGKIFIGVKDDKKIIGIDNDIKNIYKNTDKFEQDVCKQIRNDLGQGVIYNPKIVKIEDKQIYRIDIEPSKQPIYFENKEYYVRRGPSKHKCNSKETSEHIKSRY